MEPSNYLSHRGDRTYGSVLRDLHALNRTFLALLLDDAAAPQDRGLDACRVAALATLNDEQLARLAHCPYGLFDVAFADPEAWRVALEAPGALAADGAAADDAAFTLATLLYARQLGDDQADLARLLLGIDAEVMAQLLRAPLPALTRCAFAGAPPLRARLARHPNFWDDIVDFVRDGTRERQLAAHTRGVQHSAFGG